MIRGILTTILFLHWRHVYGSINIIHDYMEEQYIKRICSENEIALFTVTKSATVWGIAKYYADILDNEYQYFVDMDPDEVKEALGL